MAVLAHPPLGTGGNAPTANAELCATPVPYLILKSGIQIPHPDPASLSSGSGGDSAVGYAS